MPVPGPVADALMVWIEDEDANVATPVPGPVAEASIV